MKSRPFFNPDTFHAEASKHAYKYFVSLLGLYSGARLNELARLDSKEVFKTESGFWCLKIKTLKQKTERYRLVPVHSHLIDLGFIEYAEKQKSSLFPELHESRDGKGQIVSKWYNRYRRSVGLTKKRNQDFHCYRHTVATNLAKQGVASTTISQILGH